MHISNPRAHSNAIVESRIKPDFLTCISASLALLLFAAFCQSAHAQSLFGSIDPFNASGKVAPAPSQRWMPDQALPQVPLPTAMQDLPAELNKPLSLAELTEIALTLNTRTRQAWLSARVEAAQSGIDHAGDFPQLSAVISDRISRPISGTSGFPNTTAIDLAGNSAAVTTRPPNNGVPYSVFTAYGPTLNLSYVLFDFGKRAADKEATEYRLLAANLSQNRTLQDVAFQVEQAYYRVLGFEQLVRATRESLRNFQTGLDATQRRHESGLATVADVYRSETQVGQAQLVLTRNEGELSKARGILAGVVGVPVNFNLQLQAMNAAPPVAEITKSMDELLASAKINRPDLIATEARARAARATARAESRAGLPTLQFNAQYGRQIYTNALTEQDAYTVGVNLSIPIFSGFGDTYRVRRREEEAKIAASTRDQAYSQTEQDVWQSYFDLQTAASSIASSANLVKSASQSADAAVARYKGGVGSLLDLITAQLDDTNAKVQEIQSRLDWYQALARLNFAIGAFDSKSESK
ncbi:MAG: Protein CyaE [Betaproteobacteria bacterium]|nr:Protein CyaE [Betaproteobacteria bacterium]